MRPFSYAVYQPRDAGLIDRVSMWSIKFLEGAALGRLEYKASSTLGKLMALIGTAIDGAAMSHRSDSRVEALAPRCAQHAHSRFAMSCAWHEVHIAAHMLPCMNCDI